MVGDSQSEAGGGGAHLFVSARACLKQGVDAQSRLTRVVHRGSRAVRQLSAKGLPCAIVSFQFNSLWMPANRRAPRDRLAAPERASGAFSRLLQMHDHRSAARTSSFSLHLSPCRQNSRSIEREFIIIRRQQGIAVPSSILSHHNKFSATSHQPGS